MVGRRKSGVAVPPFFSPYLKDSPCLWASACSGCICDRGPIRI